MTKRFLPALLASAALLLTLPACGPSNGQENTDEDIATTPLPPLPPAPADSASGSKNDPSVNPGSDVSRPLTAQNATEDIKKMQPQM